MPSVARSMRCWSKTGACSATISRVNRSLNYGTDAYRTIFARLAEEEK